MLTVAVGSSKVDDGEAFEVAEIIFHPLYQPFDYDFLILRLKTRVTLSSKVGIIKLPDEDDISTEGEMCLLSGWGGSDTFKYTEYLIGVNIPVTGFESCKESWNLTERMICAGSPLLRKFIIF